MIRNIRGVLTALALSAAPGLALADENASLRLPAPGALNSQGNQSLADELAQTVRTSGRFQNYLVDVEANGGVVTLTGHVQDRAQHTELMNIARRMPGVVAVNDKVQVSADEGPVMARYEAQEAPRFKAVAPSSENNPGKTVEPAPVTAFRGGVMPHSDAPAVPPYAWPAYTPYNNYASMAYQTQYPSGAWPFVGPPYPYPMIPAGWRHVSLKWKGGYWFMRFHSH